MNVYGLTGFKAGPRPSLRPEKTKLFLMVHPITLGHTGTHPEQVLPKEPLPPSTESRAGPLPTPALHEDEGEAAGHMGRSRGRV